MLYNPIGASAGLWSVNITSPWALWRLNHHFSWSCSESDTFRTTSLFLPVTQKHGQKFILFRQNLDICADVIYYIMSYTVRFGSLGQIAFLPQVSRSRVWTLVYKSYSPRCSIILSSWSGGCGVCSGHCSTTEKGWPLRTNRRSLSISSVRWAWLFS